MEGAEKGREGREKGGAGPGYLSRGTRVLSYAIGPCWAEAFSDRLIVDF